MLTESCRACLAIVLDRNDLASVLFDNLSREYFQGAAALVFQVIQEHAGDGMDLHWSTIKDAVGARVNPAFWQALMDSTRGLHPSGAEAYLRERIHQIKTEHGKRKLLTGLGAIAAKPELEEDDIDELEKTTQAMRLIDRPKESSSLASALSAYQEHIRQAASDITFGFRTLDRQIDGFNAGELVTVMARAGVGKTFVALNIIDHLAGKIPFKMALFSLEMPKAAVIERLLEVHFGISRHEAKRLAIGGELDVVGFEQRFAQLAIYDKIYSVSEIRKLVEREGFRVIFVDFLHLVRPEVIGSPYQQISQVIADIKRLAKDTGSVAFLMHQLSRQAGSGWTKVEASHARDSGQIEELSDFILGVWAPGLNPDAGPDLDGVLSCSLLKNKRGSRWHYDLSFDKNCGRIREEGDDDGYQRGTREGQRGTSDWSESRATED